MMHKKNQKMLDFLHKNKGIRNNNLSNEQTLKIETNNFVLIPSE